MSKTFDKLIIHTAYLYLDEALKGDICYQKDKVRLVKSKLSGLSIGYKFTNEEHRRLVEVGNSDVAKRIKSVEIDFSVYATSLLYEYVTRKPKADRIRFNISDKKIKELRGEVIKDMLELKSRDSDKYEELKEVVDQSKRTAREFYLYFEENL